LFVLLLFYVVCFIADKQTISSIAIWQIIIYKWCLYCCIICSSGTNIDPSLYTIIFFKMSFIDKLDGDWLFYSFLQSFWLSSIIGSRPLIWSLILCFLPWTGYSVNVSSFQLHITSFFPYNVLRHKYQTNKVSSQHLHVSIFILSLRVYLFHELFL